MSSCRVLIILVIFQSKLSSFTEFRKIHNISWKCIWWELSCSMWMEGQIWHYFSQRVDIYVITIFWLYVHYTYTVKSCRYTVCVLNYATCWTIWCLNPRMGRRFIFFTRHPDRFWGSPSLQFNKQWGALSLGVKWPGC